MNTITLPRGTVDIGTNADVGSVKEMTHILPFAPAFGILIFDPKGHRKHRDNNQVKSHEMPVNRPDPRRPLTSLLRRLSPAIKRRRKKINLEHMGQMS